MQRELRDVMWSGSAVHPQGYGEEEYIMLFKLFFSNQVDVNVVTLFLIGKDVLIFIRIQEMQLEDQKNEGKACVWFLNLMKVVGWVADYFKRIFILNLLNQGV